MTELTIAQTMAIDKIHATIAERDRLKALNAELMAVLQNALMPFRESVRNPSGTMVGEPEWCAEARAVLAKARKEG